MLYILAATGFAGIVGFVLLGVISQRSGNAGLVNGQLRPCPNSPNCVCSLATDREHSIAPIPFSGDAALVIAKIADEVQSLPRTRVVLKTQDYLHVEFRSALFRFVDDVEFLVEPATQQIQIRSASRVGRSDLGVNRERMEQLRRLLEPALVTP